MYSVVFDILVYLIMGAAVLLVWLVKGCKGPLKEEFSERYKKRNILASLILWSIIILFIVYINN